MNAPRLEPLAFPPAQTPAFSIVWRAQSPFGPCVGVAIPGNEQPLTLPEDLAPEERAFAQAASPFRARTFAAGRVALRAACAAAGLPPPPAVLAGPQGEPALPSYMWGSITHKHNLAVAIAAPAEGVGGLGIDLESMALGKVDIAARVLRPEELERLAKAPSHERARQTRLAFCMKEALYKAAFPVARQFFGFHEGRVGLPFDAAVERFVTVAAAVFPKDMSEKTTIFAEMLHSDTAALALAKATRNQEYCLETGT